MHSEIELMLKTRKIGGVSKLLTNEKISPECHILFFEAVGLYEAECGKGLEEFYALSIRTKRYYIGQARELIVTKKCDELEQDLKICEWMKKTNSKKRTKTQ